MSKNNSGPIDSFMYHLCEQVADPLHHLGITPNMITSFALLLSINVYISLKNKQKALSIAIIIFRYFLDNLDGFMARKYKQFSVVGDFLDHIGDTIFNLTVVYQLYKLNPWNVFKTKLIVLFCFVYIMCTHLGCQEKLSNNDSSLNCTKFLCHDVSWVKYTKYFDPGTFMIVLCLMVWF